MNNMKNSNEILKSINACKSMCLERLLLNLYPCQKETNGCDSKNSHTK